MRRIAKHALALAASVAALAAVATAQAAPSTTASGSCYKGVGGLLDNDPSLNPQCPGGLWQDPRPGALSQASWSASAGLGVLQASASSAINTLAPLGFANPLALGIGAQGVAGFSDDLLFDAASLSGQAGKVVFSLWLDGLMATANSTANAASKATWQLRASSFLASNNQFLGQQGTGASLDNFYDWGQTGNPNVAQAFGFELPIIFGQPVRLDVQLLVTAYGSGWRGGSPGSPTFMMAVQSSAASNFGNTMLWNGISGVQMANGAVVQNWSLSSASGVNYVSAIPEPSSAALLALGAVFTGWRAGAGRGRKRA